MIDLTMKKVLLYMNRQENASSRLYNWGEDLDAIASEIGTDPVAARACIRYLERYEYIAYVRDQYGKVMRFSLDHKGLHWQEYRREEILRYIRENWIDFLAMIFALISLGLSLSTYFGWSVCQ